MEGVLPKVDPIPRPYGKADMSTTAVTTNTSRASFTALNEQWERVHADQPIPPAWTADFADAQTLQGVLDLLRSTPDPDAPLLALIARTQDGDETAGRVLLQTMLGKLHQIGRTAIGRGLDDAAHEALLAFYTATASYPLERDTKVAANLSMRCLNVLPARRGALETSCGIDQADDSYLERLLDRHEHHQTDPTDDLVTLLAWALDEQVLDRDQVALLGRRYLAAQPPTSDELADELGVSSSAVRKRCAAAVRALSEAVVARAA